MQSEIQYTQVVILTFPLMFHILKILKKDKRKAIRKICLKKYKVLLITSILKLSRFISCSNDIFILLSIKITVIYPCSVKYFIYIFSSCRFYTLILAKYLKELRFFCVLIRRVALEVRHAVI